MSRGQITRDLLTGLMNLCALSEATISAILLRATFPPRKLLTLDATKNGGVISLLYR